MPIIRKNSDKSPLALIEPGYPQGAIGGWHKSGWVQKGVPVDRRLQLSYNGWFTSESRYRLGPDRRSFFVPNHGFNLIADTIAQRFWNGTPILESSVLQGAIVAAQNKLYAKVVDDVRGDAAELFTGLLEIQKSAEMVATGALRLLFGFTLLRQGKFTAFLKFWGLRRKKKHKSLVTNKSSEAGSLWLEYWMGWAPTANDILTASRNIANAGTDEIRFFRVRAGVRESGQDLEVLNDSSWFNRRRISDIQVKCLARGKVTCVNPNLALANRLGLVNPLTSLVQIMPWSWMVGWFVNIEQCLNQYSDFYGFDISEECTTTSVSYLSTEIGRSKLYADRWWDSQQRYKLTRRVPTLITPQLQFRLPARLSVTRAATCLSLLTGKLLKTK